MSRGASMWRRAAILASGALVLLLLRFGAVAGDYNRFIVASVAFNAIAVLSISVLAGTCGIWSLGHTAFIALGAYTTANLAQRGVPIEAIVPIVALAAIGFAIGLVSGRFSILYFALLTLAVTLTSAELIGRLASVTGGDQGLALDPVPSWIAGPITTDNAPQAAVVLATSVFLIAEIVIKGAPGRRWRAVKSQRIASAAIGLTPYRANAHAFAFSAGMAAVAGVGLAVTLGVLDPLIFNLNGGVMLIAATVVGGIGSFVGAVLGAAFILGVPELGRTVPDIAAFALGATMIVVLLLLPQGLGPALLGLRPTRARPPVRGPGMDAAHTVAQLARELMPACTEPLALRRLSVAFGGLRVLNDVSLDVAPGETVGLIGPNGAGKTTLINVLSGFVRPTRCERFSFGPRSLRGAAPQARLGLGIGRTFQHAELFADLTLRETLAVAAGRRGREMGGPAAIVERILAGLDLERYADAVPDTLPFGVQKVADIARTLAAGATWVALDEPFSGLDAAEIAEVRAILTGMKAAGVSILIIDHAVQEVLRIADRVVVLNFGEVLATGSPAEISRNPAVQDAYFGVTTAAPARAGAAAATVPLLRLAGVGYRYRGVLALQHVGLTIGRGSFNAVLGPNGAGKSTLAQLMTGLLTPTSGTVTTGAASARLVPEGRRLFGQLTIEDNLVVAGYGAGLTRRQIRSRMQSLAPILPQALRDGLRTRYAASLSGGERQIVAVVRAMMAQPALLVIDEPSMGLAPVVTDRLYGILAGLRADGVTVVVMEQIATHAAQHADALHLLSQGQLVYSGPACGAATQDAIKLSYVGHVET